MCSALSATIYSIPKVSGGLLGVSQFLQIHVGGVAPIKPFYSVTCSPLLLTSTVFLCTRPSGLSAVSCFWSGNDLQEVKLVPWCICESLCILDSYCPLKWPLSHCWLRLRCRQVKQPLWCGVSCWVSFWMMWWKRRCAQNVINWLYSISATNLDFQEGSNCEIMQNMVVFFYAFPPKKIYFFCNHGWYFFPKKLILKSVLTSKLFSSKFCKTKKKMAQVFLRVFVTKFTSRIWICLVFEPRLHSTRI